MALSRLTKVPTSMATDIVDSATDAIELLFDNVDNTRDLDKPVSDPTNAFVQTSINNLIAGAPIPLNTLDKLANAIGDNPNFATTITNLVNDKASVNGAEFIGKIVLPASSTYAPFNVPHGTTPVAVINGDIWTSTLGLHARVNGENRTFIHDGTIGAAIEAIAFTAFEKSKTGNYTVAKTDQGDLITATSASPVTFTMSTVAILGQGFVVAFKNLGDGTLTIAASSGENIDGGPSIDLATGEAIMLSCNGIAFRSVFKNTINGSGLTNLNASALTTGTVDAARLPSTLTGISMVNTSFIGTVTGLTKDHVGLTNVNNTSDLGKPISTATQTALSGKVSAENILLSNAVVLRDPAFKVSIAPTETGTIAIQLPGWGNNMMRMKVSVYDYSADKSFSVEISGYTFATTETWVNTSARIIDSPTNNSPPPIRFGVKAGKPCIWIGEQTRVWNYPQIFVTEIATGYVYGVALATGIGVSIDSIYGTVQRTILPQDTKPVFQAHGTAAAGYFYALNPIPYVTVPEGSAWFTGNTFTAPVPGVYSFTAGILKNGTAGDAQMYLIKSDGTTGPAAYSNSTATWTQLVANWQTYTFSQNYLGKPLYRGYLDYRVLQQSYDCDHADSK